MKKPDNFIFRYGDDLKNFPEDLKPKIQEELRYLWGKFKDVTSEQKQIYKVFEKDENNKVLQRYWEMFLYDFLEQQGKSISVPNQGADFLVNDNIYVEAIAPIQNDRIKKCYRTIRSGKSDSFPDDECSLKILSAIEAKSKKFLEDIEKKYIERNKINIIALNGCNLGMLTDVECSIAQIPRILGVCFGVEFKSFNIGKESGEILDSGYTFRENIQKSNLVDVDASIFLTDGMKHISGIIYSNKNMYHNALGRSLPLYFVHNPYAENKLSYNYFDFDHEYCLNEEGVVSEV